MKIRTQNILTITPIFVVMIIIIDIMTFTTQREELQWGMREEVATLSASISEYIDRKTVVDLINKNKRNINALKTTLEKIKQYKQLHRLSILTPDAERVVFEFGEKKQTEAVHDQAKLILDKISKDGIYVSDITDAGVNSVIMAFSPIKNNKDKQVGIVGVAIKADYYFTRLRTIIAKILVISFITILIGILASFFISRVITNKLNHLNEAASLMNLGNYDKRVEVGTIKEVSDLGNTFNTMSSILGEELSRTKRALIESEQFRTSGDIAKRFNDLVWKPIDQNFGDYHVLIRDHGNISRGDFYGIVEADSRLFLIMGRVNEKNYVQASITASAAYSLIEDELKKKPPSEVITDVVSLFPIDTLRCIFMQSGTGKKIQETKFDNTNNDPVENIYDFNPENPLVFHTFDKKSDEIIQLYIKLFKIKKPEELMNGILTTLPYESKGIILIIGRS